MKLILLALFAVLLRAQEPAGAIVVTVTDALSRLPVDGARIALRGPAPGSATTSADGAFRFEHLVPGEYNITVTKSGYLDSTKGSVHHAVTLKAGVFTETASLALTPLGALEGAVLDEEGKPMAGVYVSVATFSVPTNKDGRFAFEDLIPDTYQIVVNVPHAMRAATLSRDESTGEFYGYAPAQFYPGAADARLAIPVQVPAGSRLRNMDFRLRRTHLVEFAGRLVDITTGQPANGTVQLLGNIPGTSDPLWTKRSPGPDGAFRFSLLTPGSYKLAVFRGPLPYIVPIELGKAGADDMRIPVPPLTTLTGRIRVRDPKLVWTGTPGIKIRHHNGNSIGPTAPCLVQPDGDFECSEVPPGDFFFDVELNQRVSTKYRTVRLAVSEIRFGRQDALYRPVVVAENGNPPIEILLSDEPAGVAGKVIDEASKTSNYMVMVSRPSTQLTVAATVGPPDFQIPTLAPGEYEITAYRVGAGMPKGTLMGATCPETSKVTVRQGSVSYITLRVCASE
ncbi:MAG: carboxypeptidase-like regulatory domain-containing protein [Candidatus Solibacter sp.]